MFYRFYSWCWTIRVEKTDSHQLLLNRRVCHEHGQTRQGPHYPGGGNGSDPDIKYQEF